MIVFAFCDGRTDIRPEKGTAHNVAYKKLLDQRSFVLVPGSGCSNDLTDSVVSCPLNTLRKRVAHHTISV